MEKRRQAGRSQHASRDRAMVDEWRASVWSARSLLPLLEARVVVDVVARGEKRRQAGRTPNASRTSEALGTSREYSERVQSSAECAQHSDYLRGLSELAMD